MRNVDLFRKYLNMLSKDYLQKMVEAYFLECVPEYFWVIGDDGFVAPDFAKGYGGLVRHTMATTEIATRLFGKFPYPFSADEKDAIIIACLIHDTVLYGAEHDERIYDDMFRMLYKPYAKHAEVAVETFKKFVKDEYGLMVEDILSNAILTHHSMVCPENPVFRCVHEAVNFAEMEIVDFPEIREYYEEALNFHLRHLRWTARLHEEENFEIGDMVNFRMRLNNNEIVFEHFEENESIADSWILYSESARRLLMNGTTLLVKNIARALPETIDVVIEDIQMIQVGDTLKRFGVVSLCS